jgi:glycosyltransferase involved in cell wall biosynthesis
MTKLLYITADRIGTPTGGGSVTYHELQALKSLGDVAVYDRERIGDHLTPFEQDEVFAKLVSERSIPDNYYGECYLAHCYSGCLSETVSDLHDMGITVSYTAAAHDVSESLREHEKLGLPFDYPHLTEAQLWHKYVSGYLLSDVLICPSDHSARIMRRFGYRGDPQVIPHGHSVQIARPAPFPDRFRLGYFGAIGPDKGLTYLLEAWKQLNYRDGSQLVFGGVESTRGFLAQLINHVLGEYSSSVEIMGWTDDIAKFYNGLSLYVQPSVTEGFGIPVLEALAYGRCVLCSTGAGAADVLPTHAVKFEPRDVKSMVTLIDHARRNWLTEETSLSAQEIAKKYQWSNVRERYVNVWKEALKK